MRVFVRFDATTGARSPTHSNDHFVGCIRLDYCEFAVGRLGVYADEEVEKALIGIQTIIFSIVVTGCSHEVQPLACELARHLRVDFERLGRVRKRFALVIRLANQNFGRRQLAFNAGEANFEATNRLKANLRQFSTFVDGKFLELNVGGFHRHHRKVSTLIFTHKNEDRNISVCLLLRQFPANRRKRLDSRRSA